MKRTDKSRRSRSTRLTKLAQALVRCAGPDVYFTQNEGFQQVNISSWEPGAWTCVVPEQLLVLARVKDYGRSHHS
jgi:secreted trypsin-like serine protease